MRYKIENYRSDISGKILWKVSEKEYWFDCWELESVHSTLDQAEAAVKHLKKVREPIDKVVLYR